MSGARRRDLVRGLFRRHDKSASDSASPQASAPSQTVNVGSTAATSQPTIHPNRSILDSAADALPAEDRETIQNHLVQGKGDIGAAVACAYQAAIAQKQVCEDKQWRWTLRNGKSVLLRDEANKVLAWLDRFKTIGDVVANVDPVHVGLPWAGIRVLLETVVSESRQMASLLRGLNLSLTMANRLQLYCEYFLRLPSSLSTTNLEETLVKTYARVLQFLAAAIRTYQMNVRTRVWQALWQDSIIERFEIDIDKLALEAEFGANNCDRQILAQNWDNVRSWKSDLNTALRKIDAIHGIENSLNSLHVKADLTKLAVAKDATYNSYVEGQASECLSGTRTQILNQVADWTNASHSKRIFWLCGMAGTGKSTISRTIAHELDKQDRLGASFFFKRGEGDRGNASLFFPTIAAQMLDKIPSLSNSVAAALDADSLLCTRSLQLQFEKLLLDPMLHLSSGGIHFPAMIIVIDALDECERNQDIRTLLKLLARLDDVASLNLHIFVTSRPELPIQLGFQLLNGDLHEDMILEEVQASTIEHDIRAYFRHQLGIIREEDRLIQPYDPLPPDWPGEDNIEALVSLALPLFIFAFTICLYISESNPRKRLTTILQQQEHSSLSGLEKTYQPILNQLIVLGTGTKHDTAIADFQSVVGPIILLADPLSSLSLSSLLDIPLRDIGDVLKNLHSVLSVPKDQETPIRLLHLSFRDYLTDIHEKGNNPFWIDKNATHSSLAKQCLQRIDQPGVLRQDLCDVRNPGTRRAHVSRQQISDAIAPDVAYACCYWVWHLVESGEEIHDNDQVHRFLQHKFLHWLEALSWLGKISDAIAYIADLKALVSIVRGDHLQDILEDMRRFILRYLYIIDLAPLQLYHSAIVFTPTQSKIRRLNSRHESHLLIMLPMVLAGWSSEIQKLEGHSSCVYAVAFSPDGLLLASASLDRTVRLWSTSTGEEIHKFQGHNQRVVAVSFSPDGLLVVSASSEGIVRLWSTTTGEEVQRLVGHEKQVNAVVFAPDGQIASASDDGTVRLWNALTGKEVRSVVGSNRQWNPLLRFSPDGHKFVSACENDTIQLRDVLQGEVIQEIEQPYIHTTIVAFSAIGRMVALGGSDEPKIAIWDTSTHEVEKKFTLERSEPTALAFSPDGRFIVSASSRNIIQQWRLSAGQQYNQNFEGHAGVINSVAFSPNGQTIASASDDGTVRLWSASTLTERIKRLPGHRGEVLRIMISSEGQRIVSASLDGTVRLWHAVSGEVIKVIKMSTDAIAFSPDGQVFALSYGFSAHLYNASTGDRILSIGSDDAQSDEYYIISIVFSLDGQIIALLINDRSVRLWSASTGEMVHRIDFESQPSRMTFSDNGKVLSTNIGNFDVSLHVPFSEASLPTASSHLTINEQWIQYQGQDLLWLPFEYRGHTWAVHENTVVIGQTSGAVTIVKFREDLGKILV